MPAGAATAAELELAAKLIALGSTSVDWTRYRDTSAEELEALIEAKVAQQPPTAPEEPVAVLYSTHEKRSSSPAMSWWHRARTRPGRRSSSRRGPS